MGNKRWFSKHGTPINGKKHKSSWLNRDFKDANNAAIRENKKMIKLPGLIKEGKKYGSVNNHTSPSGGQGSFYNGTGSWSSGVGSYQKQWCKHEGNKVVFESDGKQLFAAAGRDLNEFSGKWDLIIDLASNIRPATSFVKRGHSNRFDILGKFQYKPGEVKSEVLSLDWNDMGAPPVSLDFWLTLWNMLPAKTVVACVGGHGRTGTCLASLMIASGVDYYSAVQTVRNDHCDSAIESLTQEKYLHGIYLDRLARELATATEKGEKGDITDISEDIKYAASHIPTQKSSYGDEEDTLPVIVTPVTGDSGNGVKKILGPSGINVKDTPPWMGEDVNTKVVNGVVYCSICVDPHCNEIECIHPSHMGWVKWDETSDEDRGWGV